MLNEYRDETERFLRQIGDFQKHADQKLDWLREEYDLLCTAVNLGDREKTAHEIYDMMYLLFELAADNRADLDAQWEQGRKRKQEKYPEAVRNREPTMQVELRDRTEEHVREYFRQTRDEEIRNMLPGGPATEEEAVENFHRTLVPGAASFGRTIYADGCYVGDVWITCIHEESEPDAMLSYCVFDKARWGQGVATEAVRQFLPLAAEKFDLHTVGAFTYAENAASLWVLKENGFVNSGRFTEDGVESCYCTLHLPRK